MEGTLGVAHDRVNEALRIEGGQIICAFTETDKLHGNTQAR